MLQRALYLGAFLTPESCQKLLKKVPAMHSKVHAGHMTIAFKPDIFYQTLFPVGKKVKLLVTGVYHDEKAQAVSVISIGIKSLNEHPHITVSTADGIPPKYSNELVATSKRKKWKFMLLDAVTDTYPRRILNPLSTRCRRWSW